MDRTVRETRVSLFRRSFSIPITPARNNVPRSPFTLPHNTERTIVPTDRLLLAVSRHYRVVMRHVSRSPRPRPRDVRVGRHPYCAVGDIVSDECLWNMSPGWPYKTSQDISSHAEKWQKLSMLRREEYFSRRLFLRFTYTDCGRETISVLCSLHSFLPITIVEKQTRDDYSKRHWHCRENYANNGLGQPL